MAGALTEHYGISATDHCDGAPALHTCAIAPGRQRARVLLLVVSLLAALANGQDPGDSTSVLPGGAPVSDTSVDSSGASSATRVDSRELAEGTSVATDSAQEGSDNAAVPTLSDLVPDSALVAGTTHGGGLSATIRSMPRRRHGMTAGNTLYLCPYPPRCELAVEQVDSVVAEYKAYLSKFFTVQTVSQERALEILARPAATVPEYLLAVIDFEADTATRTDSLKPSSSATARAAGEPGKLVRGRLDIIGVDLQAQVQRVQYSAAGTAPVSPDLNAHPILLALEAAFGAVLRQSDFRGFNRPAGSRSPILEAHRIEGLTLNSATAESHEIPMVRFDPYALPPCNPYLVNCLNSVLKYYSLDTLSRAVRQDSRDTTASSYVRELYEHGAILYRLVDVRTAELKALVECNIPVLLFGSVRSAVKTDYGFTADIIRSYGEPEMGRVHAVGGEPEVAFGTVRKLRIYCKADGKAYLVDSDTLTDYSGFQFAAVLGSPAFPIDSIVGKMRAKHSLPKLSLVSPGDFLQTERPFYSSQDTERLKIATKQKSEFSTPVRVALVAGVATAAYVLFRVIGKALFSSEPVQP